MSARHAFAGWITATLVGCVATAALARLFIRAKPDAEELGYAWFAAPGAALALVALLLARKVIVSRAKDLTRGHLGPGPQGP